MSRSSDKRKNNIRKVDLLLRREFFDTFSDYYSGVSVLILLHHKRACFSSDEIRDLSGEKNVTIEILSSPISDDDFSSLKKDIYSFHVIVLDYPKCPRQLMSILRSDELMSSDAICLDISANLEPHLPPFDPVLNSYYFKMRSMDFSDDFHDSPDVLDKDSVDISAYAPGERYFILKSGDYQLDLFGVDFEIDDLPPGVFTNVLPTFDLITNLSSVSGKIPVLYRGSIVLLVFEDNLLESVHTDGGKKTPLTRKIVGQKLTSFIMRRGGSEMPYYFLRIGSLDFMTAQSTFYMGVIEETKDT